MNNGISMKPGAANFLTERGIMHIDTTKKDNVNHPSHYQGTKFEVIEVIEDLGLGFHLGNAIKYLCRAGKKNQATYVEDLEKAIWYIRRRIELCRPAEDVRRPNDMAEPRKDGIVHVTARAVATGSGDDPFAD